MKKITVSLLIIWTFLCLLLPKDIKPESKTFYSGVYSGCFLMLARPNMREIEIENLDIFCSEQTTRAMEFGLMELYYTPQTEVPQINPQSSTNS